MFLGHSSPQWYFDYVVPVLGIASALLFVFMAAMAGKAAEEEEAQNQGVRLSIILKKKKKKKKKKKTN